MKDFMKNLGAVFAALMLGVALFAALLYFNVASRSTVILLGVITFSIVTALSMKKRPISGLITGAMISGTLMLSIVGVSILVKFSKSLEAWKGYTLIGIVIIIVVFIIIKTIKRIYIIPTNEILIIQGIHKTGFYTSNEDFQKDKRCLGKWFLLLFKFMYKFKSYENKKPVMDRLPVKPLIFDIGKKPNSKEAILQGDPLLSEDAIIQGVTKDNNQIGVIVSLQLKIDNVFDFFNHLWAGSYEKTLEEAKKIFSPVTEGHLEPIIRTYTIDGSSLDNDDSEKEKSPKSSRDNIDQLKSEIAHNTIKNLHGKEWKNTQTNEENDPSAEEKKEKKGFSYYGLRLIDFQVLDFTGKPIKDFRDNAAAIQDLENKIKLSDQTKKTNIRTHENDQITKVREQEKLEKIATAETSTQVQLNKKAVKIAEGLKEKELVEAESAKQVAIKKAEAEAKKVEIDAIASALKILKEGGATAEALEKLIKAQASNGVFLKAKKLDTQVSIAQALKDYQNNLTTLTSIGDQDGLAGIAKIVAMVKAGL